MRKNSSQVDHVIVIRSQGALLDLKAAVDDAFVECFSWLSKLLGTGKATPPATIRLSDSNGEWLTEAVVKDFQQRPEMRQHHPEKIDPPLFAVMEDSRGKRFTVRIQLDSQMTS